MKKILSILLVAALGVTCLAGCKKDSQKTVKGSDGQELPVVRIAAVPGLPGVPSLYLSESGLDEKYGFKAEIQFYASGIPMNEALAAGLWDVGPIGAAAVTSLAMYDAKLVADINAGLPGVSMLVPANSPIANVTGKVNDHPNVKGDADSVRGKKILTVRGAMMHYLTLLYLDSIGLTENDVELIHMEQSQLATAFKSNTADMASMGPPSATFQLLQSGEAKEVCTFTDLDNPQMEVLVASNKFYNDNYDLLVKVVAASLEASDKLVADKDLQKKYLSKWYKDNGQDIDDATLDQEVGDTLITSEEIKDLEVGKFMKGLAQFNADNNMLDPKLVSKVEENVKANVVTDALKLMAEKNK